MNKNVKVNFSKNLKFLRDQQNLSQRQLAKLIDIPQATISRWEGMFAEPSPESLWVIADYFDVSIDYLIGRSDV